VLAALGLPSVPGVTCPSTAATIAGAGLGPICTVASGITGVAKSAASSVVGFGADSVLDALGSWVSSGATWLLGQIGKVIADTTTIDLGASWFTAHYQIMVALAGVVIVPMLLLGIIQSVYRQNASTLIRSVLVNVPLAILLTAVAVKLVQLGLAVTDAMSATISQGAGLDGGHFLSSVTLGLSGASVTGQSTTPAFVMFVGGLAVVFGALMVWVELLIRAAAVYVAVLFLPLALASLAWPAIAHWCRRLVDTLVALVLGKFVIVSVLSLAAGALAVGSGSAPAGGAGSAAPPALSAPAGSGGGGFAAVLGGAALLLFAAFAPWALFRLLPFLEAGAVGHLESLSHRAHQGAGASVRSLAHTAMRAASSGSLAGGAAGAAGGLLSGSLAGSVARGGGRPGSDGGHGAGATVGGPGGIGGGPGGGADTPTTAGGSGPDPGPSSAESTGVGTMESPGHGIPMWPAHPVASVAGRRAIALAEEESARRTASSGDGSGPVPGAGPAPSADARIGVLAPMPRQPGTRNDDFMSWDALGVKLVSRRMPAAPDPGGSPAPSDGERHGG
jgi:hypothetical protein